MSQDIVEGWALIKRGLYWRPDAQGYTGLKSEAGCYSDADASGYSEHGDGTTKMRWADAPELAPSCSDESARRYYAALITTLTAERAEALVQSMREAVEQAFKDGLAYGNNVADADPDVAWQQSRVRAALSRSEV